MAFELNAASLKAICRQYKLYEHRPDLNDVLYLHHKGITEIKSLEAFTGVKALYLECNAISCVEGLAHMTELRSLYIAKNMLHDMHSLAKLTSLQQLDVSDNDIRSLEGVSSLRFLRSLNASNNKLSATAGLVELLDCPDLETLDLAGNKIQDDDAWEVLHKLPISLLRLVGNPIVSNTKNYRKRLINSMPQLNNLDDMPCFERDRRLAAAFMQGGVEAERSERARIKEEESEHRERCSREFNDMVLRAQAEAAAGNVPSHDPFRFRAVPAGESDDDKSSCRALKVKATSKQLLNDASVSANNDNTMCGEAPPREVAEVNNTHPGWHHDAELHSQAPTTETGGDNNDPTAAVSAADTSSQVAALLDNLDACSYNLRAHGAGAPEGAAPPLPQEQVRALEAETHTAHASTQGPASGAACAGIPEARSRCMGMSESATGSRASPLHELLASGAADALRQRRPQVWDSGRYQQLWQMALAVGEQQSVDGEAPDELPSDEDGCQDSLIAAVHADTLLPSRLDHELSGDGCAENSPGSETDTAAQEAQLTATGEESDTDFSGNEGDACKERRDPMARHTIESVGGQPWAPVYGRTQPAYAPDAATESADADDILGKSSLVAMAPPKQAVAHSLQPPSCDTELPVGAASGGELAPTAAREAPAVELGYLMASSLFDLD